MITRDKLQYSSIKTYFVGAHLNRLGKAILMSTHIICFKGTINKITFKSSQNSHHYVPLCSKGLLSLDVDWNVGLIPYLSLLSNLQKINQSIFRSFF